MKRYKKFMVVTMVVIVMLVTSLIIPPGPGEPGKVEAATIPSIPESAVDPSGSPNTFYFVAMFYYETWQRNDGSWNPVSPGSDVSGVTFPYEFTLPGRNIKQVTVNGFNENFVAGNPQKWEEVFFQSRYHQYDWGSYVSQVSLRHNAVIQGLSGIGTSTVSFDLELASPSLMNAPDPEEFFADGGNRGERHYFPMLLTIEVEPQLIVKHFTTDGQSLGHVFTDSIEIMENGTTYHKVPPAHPDYQYVGHKKSTTGDEPVGSIIPGHPPTFTYDNTFNTYMLYLYYEESSDEGSVSARFNITPDPVPYGSTFTFHPTNVENDTGKEISRTEWHVRNPRNLSEEVIFDRASINERTVTAAQYPSWITDESRNYPVDMYVQLQGESTWHYMDAQTLRIQASDSDPNDPGNISARFEVVPDTISYRDTFRLRPIEIDTAGCTYESHQYRISHFMRASNTPKVYGKTEESVFTSLNYPRSISTGSHTIFIKVFTSDCGETDWISPENLTVLEPLDNQPPDFQVAWVERGTQTPVTEVLEGTVLDLIYLDDPPPYDPDGDSLEWMGFDLEGHHNEWVRNIPVQPMTAEYLNGWHGVTMDRPGGYSVAGSFRDQWGAVTTKNAFVTVVARNPVPIITGPSRVVEGRPLEASFRSDQSYSPIRNRTIDHTRDEWSNVREIYTTPGTEVIELHVYDNTGMKSLEPAQHELTVLEDLPPVPQLEFAPMVLRDNTVTLRNTSYSPDGDEIVQTKLRMRYDANNDGSISGESVQTLSANEQGNYTFRPTKVGKYHFELYVEEDWGKHATETFILEVVNESPYVQFDLTSEMSEPFAPSFTNIPVSEFTNSAWRAMNVHRSSMPKTWSVSGGVLRGPELEVSPYRFSSDDLAVEYKVSVPSNRYSEFLDYFFDDTLIMPLNRYYGWGGLDPATRYERGVVAMLEDYGPTWRSRPEAYGVDRVNRRVHIIKEGGFRQPDEYYSVSFADYLNDHMDDSRRRYYSSEQPIPETLYDHPLNETSDIYQGIESNDGYKIYLSSRSSRNYQLIVESPNGTINTLELSRSSDYESSMIRLADDGRLLIGNRDDDEVDPSEGDNYHHETVLVSSDVKVNTIPQSMSLLNNSASEMMTDFELRYQIRQQAFHPHLYSGFAFRIQDRRNMYRVETDGSRLRLVKIVNGTRTILQSQEVSMSKNTFYTVSIKAMGDRLQVYWNGTPYFDVSDSQFSQGRIGPYAEMEHVHFKQISYADISGLSQTHPIPNVALVDEDITYQVTVDDLENDPVIEAENEWHYQHIDQKFLNAGDGQSGWSAYRNKTYTNPVARLDKVGEYVIHYTATDDPHPNERHPSMVFDEYRKASNTFQRSVIVHRPPVASFTVSVRGDGTVQWNDASYDPDRWLHSSQYSHEDTGIDYRTTRGVLNRKYYYITPSGNVVEQQLIAPQETGTYTLGLAVMDEYGAWSDWAQQTISITEQATPDDPPDPGFTVSPSTIYRNTTVTINSTASDPEDGGRSNLPHEYYIRNVTEGDGERLVSTNRTSWTHPFSELGTYHIRQVVRDSAGQTAQFERQVEVINRRPTVNVTTPASTHANNPTMFDTAKPTFRFTYNDGDNDVQQRFEVRILRNANSQVVMNSGVIESDRRQWTPEADLPEFNTLYVQVRVHDGYEWSNWSTAKYFYIQTNKPPTADFDWTPKPVWEGDTVTLKNLSTDPDGDELTYRWSIENPEGNESEYTTQDVITVMDIPSTYRVSLSVTDPSGESHSVTKNITVGALQITGAVDHTPDWESRRLAYNEWEDVTPRSADTFWAGEIFQLTADLTDTDPSETQLENVRVILLENRFSTSLSHSPGNDLWTGELWDESFAQLADGPYTFRFTAKWSNGIEKEDLVTVNILGDMWEWVQVHRRR